MFNKKPCKNKNKKGLGIFANNMRLVHVTQSKKDLCACPSIFIFVYVMLDVILLKSQVNLKNYIILEINTYITCEIKLKPQKSTKSNKIK